MLNVQKLDEAWWSRLLKYVRDGGGLVVAPAGYADVNNYNTGLAAQLMPATLGAVREHKPDAQFRFGLPDLGSPLFAQNQKELLAELARVPISKTREVKPDPSGRTILSYTDNTPALLERVLPGPRPGKVLLWTTRSLGGSITRTLSSGMSFPTRPSDGDSWR